MRERIVNRLTALLAALALVFCTLTTAAKADGPRELESGAAGINKLGPEEIALLLRSEKAPDPDGLYVGEPDLEPPYDDAGETSAEHQAAALERLDHIRAIAGLPAVTLDGEYTRLAQAGAYVDALYGQLSHYPRQAEGLDDALFALGAGGVSSSNIAWTSRKSDLVYSVDIWANDTDPSNIALLGHRRWVMNPTMDKTGFGHCFKSGDGTYTAMYCFGQSGSMPDYDIISWPSSGYFPAGQDFFQSDTAWSVSLNPDKFTRPSVNGVKVTLTRESDGRTWEFSGAGYTPSLGDDYFNVDTAGYGVNNCIIFRPSGIGEYEGRYTVTVSGVRSHSGAEADFCYTVEFFDVDSIPDPNAPPYSDVAEGDWYMDAARFARKNRIFRDYDADTFRPGAGLTRAETAYALWAAAGFPETGFDAGFTDLHESWYVQAVNWAAENELLRGTGGGKFEPDTVLSRAMLMQVFYNYEIAFVSAAAERADLSGFADGESLSAQAGWAMDAMSWAVAAGIVNGTGDSKIDPLGMATRSQLANILMKYTK